MEHGQRAGSLGTAHEASLSQLIGGLLGVDLERFDAFSEHIYLLQNHGKLGLESLLQDLECALLAQLLFVKTVERVEAETEKRGEEALGRPSLIPTHRLLQVPQDRLLAEVVDHEEVGFIETGVQNARQNRLVIGQKLLVFAVRLLTTAVLLVLLVDDLHQRAHIDVVHL